MLIESTRQQKNLQCQLISIKSPQALRAQQAQTHQITIIQKTLQMLILPIPQAQPIMMNNYIGRLFSKCLRNNARLYSCLLFASEFCNFTPKLRRKIKIELLFPHKIYKCTTCSMIIWNCFGSGLFIHSREIH